MDVDQATEDGSVTGPNMTPEEVLITTHGEILTELQSKYTGLYNLSKKTGHKLLANIAQTIFERLKSIIEQKPEDSDSCLKLSKGYRKIHPHFGDFQLILSTLHKVQDASGAPRSQLVEQDISTHNMQPCFVDDIPLKKMMYASNKYYKRVIATILEHFKSVERKNDAYTEEDVARSKVRIEMKKMAPYMPMLVKQAISKHFMPAAKARYQKILIYGEPFLPTNKRMALFVKRYTTTAKLFRSDTMFNLLHISLPLSQCASLATVDGTVVGGAKLVIRSASDVTLYTVPDTLIEEMKAASRSLATLSSHDIKKSVEDTDKEQVVKSSKENITCQDGKDDSTSKKKTITSGAGKVQPSKLPLHLLLQRRQKQIDSGKNSIGYRYYINKVPLNRRTERDPKTPDKTGRYSRRSWDTLVRIWRTKLKAYKPRPEDDLLSGDSFEELSYFDYIKSRD